MGDLLYLLNLWILLFLQIGTVKYKCCLRASVDTEMCCPKDGCNRNVPTNVPTSNKKPNNGYTVVPENHRLPCTANETLAKSCLNGGTCFASDIASNVKQISCQCPDKYFGDRCQMIDTTIIFKRQPKSLSTTGLVAIPIICVLALISVITLIVWFQRQHRQINEDCPESQNAIEKD